MWAEPGGSTSVTYTAPTTLAARYQLTPESVAALGVVDGLTDALVAD